MRLLPALLLAPLLLAAPLAAKPAAPKPAPVSALARAVDIPFEQFTLPNGLRVIVHTDRKAPVVAVSVWYDVGSKHEPAGKTGFAHLFEHLMFNGSEHAPGDYFEPLQQIGATDVNGTTWFDRTNYFQTVPKSALEVALFLESDRMGYLLGAVTQQTLDNQRGVVQNEKRQGDTQPYGLVEYAQLANLLPPTHPYGHPTIGSMADLDQASLEDVKGWFTDHYGPNNAVLVLAGDIDAAEAKRLTEKWFGGIPAGRKVQPVRVDIPTLPARKDVLLKDQVATARLYRWWTTPGLTDRDATPLEVGASVLGGLASSRLDTILVRREQLAVRVSAELQDFAQLSFFEVSADAKPGVDPALLGQRIDEIIADFVAKGPTDDEVKRVATTAIAGRIGGLERVGGFSGKAVTLAEGALYAGDPAFYKRALAELAATTPAQVRAAMQRWLTRPVVALSVVPGARDAYEEAGGKAAQRTGIVSAPAHYLAPDAPPPPPASAAPDRASLPPIGPVPNIDFPTVETATLANGIKVHLARRTTVPAVRIALSFDAGIAADPHDKPGTQQLMVAMLDEGTKTRSALQIAQEQERLGANIGASASLDRTVVGLYALTPNLSPSLDLLADVVQNPAFDPKELERVRVTQLTGIAQALTSPQGIARRLLPPLLYGRDHPYGLGPDGLGTPASVKAITRDDLVAFHDAWLRADKAEIFVVGDITMAALLPQLDRRFGHWRSVGAPAPAKRLDQPAAAPLPRILLVDRPQSPQSLIVAGTLLDARGGDDLVDLLAANDVLGGSFLSRINMDLRETKGWSYGVTAFLNRVQGQVPWYVAAPVQADQTGPSIAALRAQMTSFLGDKGVTAAELQRTVNGSVRELPGSYETSDDVLGQMQRDAMLGRPFDYVEGLAARYQAQTAAQLDAAARRFIHPDRLVWVVIGDKAKVLPQLQPLGLPVSVVDSEGNPVK